MPSALWLATHSSKMHITGTDGVIRGSSKLVWGNVEGGYYRAGGARVFYVRHDFGEFGDGQGVESRTRFALDGHEFLAEAISAV